MERVVVVGGGVLGTMHALEARDRGVDVVHLERDAEPRRASVRNFGLVWVSGRAPGPELDLAITARARWEELGQLVPGIGFRPDGSLTAVTSEPERAVLEQVAERPDAERRGLRLVDGAGARRLNPALAGDVLAALHCSEDAVVEPRHALPALREHLAGEGYSWHPGCTVVEVGTGWVRDDRGVTHAGDQVLLCPGAAVSGAVAEVVAPLPLRSVRLHMMETRPFAGDLATSLANGDSLRYYPAFDVPARAELPPPDPVVERYAIQLLVARRAAGGLTVGDTHEYDEPFDFAVDEAPLEHLAGEFARLTGQPLPSVTRRWTGVYSQCVDGAVCHRSHPDEGVTLVTGVGGRGMTLSPAIAAETFDGLGVAEPARA